MGAHTGTQAHLPEWSSTTRAWGEPATLFLLPGEILGLLSSGSSFLPLAGSPGSSVWSQVSICP